MIRFDINGSIVEFDEKMNNYNRIRKSFKINAKKCSEEFYNYCDKNIYNITELNNYAIKYGEVSLEDAIIKSVETIISFKILTIDIETFKTKYCNKYFDFQRIISNIMKPAMNNKNRKNQYLTTESLKPLIKEIGRHLYREYFNIHLAVIDVLLDEKIENIIMPLTKENIKISNALINNYKDGFIDEIDEPNVINKIVSLNPYRIDLYEHIINEDGDFNRGVEALVEYIGDDLKPYKEKLVSEYIDKCLKEDNRVEFIKEKVTKYCKYMGVINEELYLTRIDAIFMFAQA